MAHDDKKKRACKAAKSRFKRHDVSGDGRLDLHELSTLLRRGDPNLKDSELRRLFREIDANADGRIDFGEFCDYLFDQHTAATKPVPKDVKAAFEHFHGVNGAMSSSEFYKFCKESCLHNSSFRQSDAAIIFSKVKPKSQREIGIRDFAEALDLIADKRGCDVKEVHQALAIFADHSDQEAPSWSRQMDAFERAHRKNIKASQEVEVGVDGRRTGKLLDVFLARSLDEVKGNITGRMMMEILEDSGLLCKRFKQHEAQAMVDRALERSCEVGSAGTLTFDHFSEILFQISQKMGCDFAAVEEKVAALAE